MSYAIVFADGAGSRMKSPDLTKQFIEVNGKPIIVYTLEHFQNHKGIKGVIVVFLKQWIPHMLKHVAQFGLCRVLNVISGNSTCHESIHNRLCSIKGVTQPDDAVLLHDGMRTIIDAELISNNMDSVKKFCNAISMSGATEAVRLINSKNESNDHHTNKILSRNNRYIGRAPHSFHYSEIMKCHKNAIEDNYTTTIDSTSMLENYGHERYSTPRSHLNIKITPYRSLSFPVLRGYKEEKRIA